MADDINKKITIEVELDTAEVSQNIKALNTVIDELLTKQQKLSASGQQNATAVSAVNTQLETFQKKLKDLGSQISSNVSGLNTLTDATKSLNESLASSVSQHKNNAKATSEASSKTNELTAILGKSAKAVDNSRESFDAHKKTMEHLKKSFDEVKDVSGIFGPSLKEAAEGFGAMKSGFKLVQDGLTGVGTAIKADGFDFLLEILQLMFNYFIKTADGSKMLKGAISAIGVVINGVQSVFHAFTDSVVNAFSHPLESLKAFGTMIEQNLINRFKAFGVILDGIIHLDFKKITNGTIQSFTGVTNVIDKSVTALSNFKKVAVDTASQMVTAYKKGTELVTKQAIKQTKIVKKSSKEQQDAIRKTLQETLNLQDHISDNHEKSNNRSPQLDSAISAEILENKNSAVQNPPTIDNGSIASEQKTQDQIVQIKKTALQQVEDYARQSGAKIATDALNILSNSIKQQSQAQIASLEKDKASELNNKSLTAAQKLAIQQKYQQQENQVKVKAFKEEQEISIVQAIINGAQAVTKVSAQAGILAPLEIGVVVAETAAQVAKIAAQKPPAYAKGGLHYSSDGRGGVLSGYSRTDNTNAYLRSGEGIVVSEAMRTPWARNLVSAINVGFGGRDFSIANPGRGYAVGGIFTDGGDANRYYNQPVNDQKNLANTIAYQMINNFPPVYVDVKDVNNQQNILAQTINRVNL